MIDLRKVGVIALFFALPFILQIPFSSAEGKAAFHTPQEFAFWADMVDSLPKGYNSLFAASGECQQCHGFDTAMVANVDLAGNDINVVDDWRATMMANSAKDPFWRAKVSHEVLLYPQHQVEIETKCTSCHAPMGHFAAFHDGETTYSLQQAMTDTFALDGVSCLACHQQSDEELGQNHSGKVLFDTAKVAYGPFTSPLSSPMLLATGYEPKFSPHISDAGLCAGCHSLIVETLDYEGNLTGNTFVEQATYHEWLNSKYSTDDVSCQNCHMPALTKGSFFLANGFDTEPRDTFYLHDLVGANTTMLHLLKENREVLGIPANEEQFDEVIEKTEWLLRQSTLDLHLNLVERTADTAFIEVLLLNKAGHKFPSGYPSRRAYIELLVMNMAGDTLFASGLVDEHFELYAQNADFEPHYQVINDESQAQIYELVVADVNGDVTTVLERGDSALKDNRIPPQGFVTKHTTYDTVKIAGNALNDSDFNAEFGMQGSGTDQVHYNVPMQDFYDPIVVSAKVFYQATPPKWMEEMFAESTPEIETFRTMFDEADRTPFMMVNDTIHVAGINSIDDQLTDKARFETIVIGEGQLKVISQASGRITVFDLSGRMIKEQSIDSGESILQLPIKENIVLVRLITNNQQIQIRKNWIY